MLALPALLEIVALVGGTVHPMTAGAEPAPATVLIEDGRITAVGPDLEVPAGARVVDVTDLHVLPGLIDGVVSFEAEHDVLYIAAGVTLVRDHGSPFGAVLAEKAPRLRDRNPGPFLLATGPLLGGLAAERADAVALTSAEATGRWIETLGARLESQGLGFDAFAIDESIDPPVLRALGGLAQRASVDVWGPRPRGMDWATARAAGQRGLLGLDTLLPEGVTWTQEAELPDLEPIVRALADGGWRVAPLLAGTARILRPADAYDEAWLEVISPTLELAWRTDQELFTSLTEEQLVPWRRAVARQRDLVRRLHEAGVPLLAASGAPSPWLPPGVGLVDELSEWVAAGIPAAEVLELATRGAADALGQSGRWGEIAPGRLADLTVLGSDPREGTAALREPELVVVRGRVLERFELEDLRASLAAQQAEVRVQLARSPELEPPRMPEGELVLGGQVDTQAFGRRMSTERFAVVKLEDGAIAYGVRAQVPASASEEGRELHLVQIVRNGMVETFQLDLRSTAADADEVASFSARGRRLGNERLMAVERRLGTQPLDTTSASEPIALVDASTVLSGLIVARHFPEGASYVLSFEGAAMDPLIDRWRMRVREEDRRIDVLNTRGFIVWGFEADGVPRVGVRKLGEAHLELANIRAEVRGGAGFGLADDRVYRPVEAAAGAGDGGR